MTPPSFRKDLFLVNTSGGIPIGSSGLFKSASAVSVGRDFSGSVTPIQHQRKISYQNSHLFRSSGSSRSELSNLIRVRNSQLGKSAPSLSPTSVNYEYLYLIFSVSCLNFFFNFSVNHAVYLHIPQQQQLQCYYHQRNDQLEVLMQVVQVHCHQEVLQLQFIDYHLVIMVDTIALDTTMMFIIQCNHRGLIHQFRQVQSIAQE